MPKTQSKPQAKAKWSFYKVKGIVKFTYSVNDLMAPSEEKALEDAKDGIMTDIDYSNQKGHTTIEILDMKIERLRPATKEEVTDGYGEEAWED